MCICLFALRSAPAYSFNPPEPSRAVGCISKSKNDCKTDPSVLGFADFIGKIRYNKPWIDGFKKAVPEISRDFPRFPEFSRVFPRKAKKKHQNFCILMLGSILFAIYFI